MNQIQVNNLSYCYEQRILFAGLNFEVNPGQCLLIEGDNGSGKTTLLQCLAGLKRHYQGEITYNQATIPNDDSLVNTLYIGHQNAIRSGASVGQAIDTFFTLAGCSAPASLEQSLWEFGLSSYYQQPTISLSAGQQRRLALLRIDLIAAKLWLLDEPFTNLDQSFYPVIEQRLAQHCQAGGSVVLTSHLSPEQLGTALGEALTVINLNSSSLRVACC